MRFSNTTRPFGPNCSRVAVERENRLLPSLLNDELKPPAVSASRQVRLWKLLLVLIAVVIVSGGAFGYLQALKHADRTDLVSAIVWYGGDADWRERMAGGRLSERNHMSGEIAIAQAVQSMSSGSMSAGVRSIDRLIAPICTDSVRTQWLRLAERTDARARVERTGSGRWRMLIRPAAAAAPEEIYAVLASLAGNSRASVGQRAFEWKEAGVVVQIVGEHVEIEQR